MWETYFLWNGSELMRFTGKDNFANVKRSILRILCVVIFWLTIGFLIPEGVKAAEQVKGTVTVSTNNDTLNVRSGPGKEYDVIGKAKNGQQFDASEIQDDWIKIDYNGNGGYVSLDFVQFEPDEEEITEDSSFDGEQQEGNIDNPDNGESEEGETQELGIEKYKLIFGLLGAIVVVMIIILLTIKSIKSMDDDDDYDEDEEEYDDEYEEDDEIDYEEEDDVDYEDEDDVDYEDDDEEDYEDEDDEYEYEHIVIRRPKESTKKSSVDSEDYSINIDPRYFE